ncbi:hypothetical protein [Mucilaginibacter sp. KACC 22063]|uniref:hypothetical protein n=1 Tax=Mucilaginibacter sp. KACC 22063 TaxID=3025666 RepID=UPI0023664592|nr:hypothetical protein [Mucilaginibacter sp. KACC 22063]WDF55843.1 hypothetical protein PQ461_02050 [Mucilaginibacter sp. KACC 22063]
MIAGEFRYRVLDELGEKIISDQKVKIKLDPFEDRKMVLDLPQREGVKVIYDFKESTSGKTKTFTEIVPYLLTPFEPLRPILNIKWPTNYGSTPRFANSL